MSPPLSSSSFISFRRIKYNESSAVELRAGDFIVCGGDAKDSEEWWLFELLVIAYNNKTKREWKKEDTQQPALNSLFLDIKE